jgi:hypothetical protein
MGRLPGPVRGTCAEVSVAPERLGAFLGGVLGVEADVLEQMRVKPGEGEAIAAADSPLNGSLPELDRHRAKAGGCGGGQGSDLGHVRL